MSKTKLNVTKAVAALEALVNAYDRGEAFAGSIEWSDLDEAYKLAMSALKRKPLPEPLSWSDLCDCGAVRLEHEGKHGFGKRGDCPSFRDADREDR